MLLNKNKHPRDSRVRFQHSRFRKELQKARGYKRTPSQISENFLKTTLHKIGLGSYTAKIIAGVFLLLLAYLAYIPNFLTIQHITVVGATPEEQATVHSEIETYLHSNKLLAQQNIFLLSKNKLSKYLLTNDTKILFVEKIEKKYFNSLTITLTPRAETYELQTQFTNYILYQDGIVSKKIPITEASTTPLANMVLIKIHNLKTLEIGQNALPPGLLNNFLALQNLINKNLPLTTAYLEMTEESSPDIDLFTTSGYKFLFDKNPDIQKLRAQLPLLWSKMSESQKKSLYYIDMRIPDRGFICLKNTACTVDYSVEISTTSPPSNLTPTTTTSSLPTINPK